MGEPTPTQDYEAERHVTRRCPRMDEHFTTPNHLVKPLPVPCEDCYSVESVWRRIPYEPDSRSPVIASHSGRSVEEP